MIKAIGSTPNTPRPTLNTHGKKLPTCNSSIQVCDGVEITTNRYEFPEGSWANEKLGLEELLVTKMSDGRASSKAKGKLRQIGLNYDFPASNCYVGNNKEPVESVPRQIGKFFRAILKFNEFMEKTPIPTAVAKVLRHAYK